MRQNERDVKELSDYQKEIDTYLGHKKRGDLGYHSEPPAKKNIHFERTKMDIFLRAPLARTPRGERCYLKNIFLWQSSRLTPTRFRTRTLLTVVLHVLTPGKYHFVQARWCLPGLCHKNTVYEYHLIPQTVLSKSNSLIL